MPTYRGVKFPEVTKPAVVAPAPAAAVRGSAAGGGLRMPDRVVPAPAPAPAVDEGARLANMAQIGEAIYRAQAASSAPQAASSARPYLPLPVRQGPPPAAAAAPTAVSAPPPDYLPIPVRQPAGAPLGMGAGPDVLLGAQARRYEAASLRPPPELAPVEARAVRGLEEIGRRAVGTATTDIFGLPLPRQVLERPLGSGADVHLEQMARSGLRVPERAPWVAPETWEENARLASGLSRVAQGVGTVLAPVGALVGGLAGALDWVYGKTTEPLYVGLTRDPQRELIEERGRLAQALAEGTVAADRVPAYQARITELTQQISEEDARLMNPVYALQQMYASPERVAEFRATAPWYEQLGVAFALDPTNILSFGLSKIAKIGQVQKVARSLQPVAASVDDVERALRTEGMVGAGAGRFLPWRLTNEAQRVDLLNQSLDITRLLLDPDAVPGDAFTKLEALIKNPDSLAPLTGGVSASLPAKRTSVLLRKAFTDPATGKIDLGALGKIIRSAPDRWEALAKIAQRLDDAALELFPQQPRSLPFRLRDAVYNWMAIGHMGYNPAYAVRNAVNNLTTALVDGYMPLVSAERMQEVLKRWGAMPVMAKAGISPAGVWQKQKTAVETLQGLQQPLNFSDLFAGVGAKGPTITISGNIERAFSERIWFTATMDAFRQLWRAEVADLRRRLVASGIPDDVIRALGDDLIAALNPAEVRAALRRLVGPPAPTGGAQPVSRVVAAVPQDTFETIERMFGREMAEQIARPLRVISDPAHVAPVLDALESTVSLADDLAARLQQIEMLGRTKVAQTTEGILDFLQREDAIHEASRQRHRVALNEVWERTRGLTVDERDAVWQVFWDLHLEDVKRTARAIDDLEESVLPTLGFTKKALQRSRAYRKDVMRTWQVYTERLRRTWEQSRQLQDFAARDNLWKEFQSWADSHWQAHQTRALRHFAQRGADVTEAVARTLQPAVVAPAQAAAAPAPAAATTVTDIPSLDDLFRLANEAGIQTATEAGKPLNRPLLNFARKHAGIPKDVKLSELTNGQRLALREALRRRIAERQAAAPAAAIPPTAEAPGPEAMGIIWHPLSPAAVWQSLGGKLRSLLTGARPHVVRTLPTLTPEQLKVVGDQLKDMAAAMVKTKAVAERVGVAARNFALGDYSRRRNLHDLAMFFFPYFTWYGFSIPNWGRRLARNPAIIAHYARYRRLLEQENERYWRERYGMQQVPPQFRNRLRIPWINGPLWVQLESVINPMYALVDNDFTTRELQQAPDYVNLVRRLGSYGPSLSPLIIGATALSIAHTDPVAARQLFGYQVSFSRPLKSFTAMLREWFPALQSVIPPGGAVPEGIVNPTVRGGDIWSESRIGMYLDALVHSGEVTQEEAEWAARQRSGPVWDAAKQAEAVASFYPDLFSFLVGMGMRPTTDERIRKAQMDAEWFDLRMRTQTLPPDERREAYREFHDRWGTYRMVQLAREFDPVRRLSDWTWMILDRLPTGYQRYRVFDEVGITTLIDKFYAGNGYLADPWPPRLRSLPGGEFQYQFGPRPQWTEEELVQLAEGLDKIAQKYKIPSPAQDELWEKAREIHDAKRKQALLAIQGIRGLTFSEDDIRAIEKYYPRAGTDEEKAAYLQIHPELQAFWDALDDVERTMQPEEVAIERSVYESPEAARSRMIWEESLPPGSNWRKGLTVPSYVDDLYDEAKRATLTDEQVQKALDWLQANVPAEYRATEEWRQARRENDEFKALATSQLGDDILDLVEQYGRLSTAERRAWRARNPQEYARLKEYWDLKNEYGDDHPVWDKYYGFEERPRSRGGGRRSYRRYRRYRGYRRSYGGYGGAGFPAATPVAGVTPGTAPTLPLTADQYNALLAERRSDPQFDALARLLFGADIFDLLAQWFALSEDERAAWIAQNQSLWARIQRFLGWLAGGGGQQATRTLGSIPLGQGGVRQEPRAEMPAPPPLSALQMLAGAF